VESISTKVIITGTSVGAPGIGTGSVQMAVIVVLVNTLILVLTLKLISFLEAIDAFTRVSTNSIDTFGILGAMMSLQKALIEVDAGLKSISKKTFFTLTCECGL